MDTMLDTNETSKTFRCAMCLANGLFGYTAYISANLGTMYAILSCARGLGMIFRVVGILGAVIIIV